MPFFFVFLGIRKCNFLGTFAENLLRVCLCLPVGCLNCSMHVVNRLSCGQVTYSTSYTPLSSLPTSAYLPAALISAFVPFWHFLFLGLCLPFPFCAILFLLFLWICCCCCCFCCCTLRFSHLFGAVAQTSNVLPLPGRLLVVVGTGNDFNLLLTSLKFRNCNGNTQHDFDPSIGAHNYSRSANGFDIGEGECREQRADRINSNLKASRG